MKTKRNDVRLILLALGLTLSASRAGALDEKAPGSPEGAIPHGIVVPHTVRIRPLDASLAAPGAPAPISEHVAGMEAQVERSVQASPDVLPGEAASAQAAAVMSALTGEQSTPVDELDNGALIAAATIVVPEPVSMVEADDIYTEDVMAEEVEKYAPVFARYRKEFAKAVIGQEELRDSLMLAMLAAGEGGLLLEGAPGTVKTVAAKNFAALFDMAFERIQFTDETMPSDLVGQEERDRKTGEWKVRKGKALRANVLLMDEFNRGKPKSQNGTLEVMEEGQATVGDETYQVLQPFLPIATQNPTEEVGVHPLGNAQKDRFLMMVKVAYPKKGETANIIQMNLRNSGIRVDRIIRKEELLNMQALVRKVVVSREIRDYIERIIEESRPTGSIAIVKEAVELGASPRAAYKLARAAQAYAFMDGRYYVIPSDIQAVAYRVLRHRIKLNFKFETKTTTDQLISEILQQVPQVTIATPKAAKDRARAASGSKGIGSLIPTGWVPKGWKK